MTPSVAAPGDTTLSDANEIRYDVKLQQNLADNILHG